MGRLSQSVATAGDGPTDWLMPRRCILLGAAGSGMRSLAVILKQGGHTLFGADLAWDPAASHPKDLPGCDTLAEGDVIRVKASGGQLPSNIDVCIRSQAVPDSDPMVRQAVAAAVPVISLHQAISQVFSKRQQICVAGTHGKSSTTALLSWLLSSELHPAGSFIGASYQNNRQNGRLRSGAALGTRDLAVIEACEFGNSFLQLDPKHIILTGIDGDHFDWFTDAKKEQQAYTRFLQRMAPSGTIVVNGGCPRSLAAAQKTRHQLVTWSVGSDSDATFDWHGEIVHADELGTKVRIRAKHSLFGELMVPLFGRHNMENLVAAVAMASQLGCSAAECVDRLSSFPGLQRRMELRGCYGEMFFMDDYAHHPTAVMSTLKAVRERFPEYRIRVVFEPHQVQRLQICWRDFKHALRMADDLIILPVFPAREDVTPEACHELSHTLAQEIQAEGTSAMIVDGVHSAVSTIELTGHPRDLFLTMGAGIVHQIHDEVHRRFQRDSAA